jgi:co-chaperonin GroES (HSP10)
VKDFNLQTFIPGTSLVLIQLPPVDETIKTPGGLLLYVDISYDKERHAQVYGTVLKVASEIVVDEVFRNGGKLGRRKVKIHNPLIDSGCRVYFDINAVQLAEKWHDSGGVWEHEGIKYALIPYELLICTTALHEPDNLKIVPLNNYVIAEQLESETEEQFIAGYGNAIINTETKGPIIQLQWDKYKKLLAKVVASPAGSGLNPGDTILYEQESDVCIENSFNLTLPKQYVYMKLDDVFSVMVDGFPMPFADKVIINPEPIKEFAGTIMIPESARKQHHIGVVNEIGPDVTDCKVGDRICFVLPGATKLETGEYMVRQAEVIAILSPDVDKPEAHTNMVLIPIKLNNE